MKTQVVIALAAATAIGGFAILPARAASTVNRSVSAKTSAMDAAPAGEMASPADTQHIERMVETVVNDAVRHPDVNRLASYFCNADTARLQKSDNNSNYTKDLDTQADHFNTTWKQKYGNNFDARSAKDLFSGDFGTIREGTAGKDTALLDQLSNSGISTKSLASEARIAVLNVPASHGLPDVCVPLIQEGNHWRFAAPDKLDGHLLRANLIDRVTSINAMAKWPASEQDAYRAVTHQVLLAIADKQP